MNYKILADSYGTTGGGCMVSTFEVWLPEENRTVFLFVNEESGTLATVNYMDCDIDWDESMDIEMFDINNPMESNSRFELYKECFFRFIENHCKHTGMLCDVDVRWLPSKLYGTLPDNQSLRCVNGVYTITTDGEKIYTADSISFESKLHEFQQYITNVLPNEDVALAEEQWDELYNTKINITIGSKSIDLPFCATFYNAITTMLADYIKYEL